jgi:hypothetical protein
MFGRKGMMVLFSLAVGWVLLSQLAVADKPVVNNTPWKIVGQLEEACSCAKACPCWFDSKPTRSMCSGNEVIFIEKGHYGDVPLDGLAIGNFVQSPEGKGMMESFGKWNFSYLYIDEKANGEQRKALEAVGSTVLPMSASAKHEIRVVPITRTIIGTEHKITVGKFGTYSGHLIEGGLGGSAKILNPPGADPLHKEYDQGETTGFTYSDADQNWSFQGTNYMFGTFEVDDVMYAKFAAGLSQKMQAKEAGEKK